MKKFYYVHRNIRTNKSKPEKQELILEPRRLDYKFSINWSDYQLPFDLGLKKMISQLLIGVNYGGALNITISIILENLSKILTKKNTTQSTSNQTEIKSPEL